MPDNGLTAFMTHCSNRIGDAYFRTPRTTIKEFVNLLAVLEQNPGTEWAPLVGAVTLEEESNPDLAPLPPEPAESGAEMPKSATGNQPPAVSDDSDDLATFRL
jgi:hypothetical protein